jgi:hypothetical protein
MPIQLRYDRRVRTPSLRFVVFLCSCLLAMQLSGLHLHTDLKGSGDLHGNHIHVVDPDGHGHESDADVSFMELFRGWVKPILFLLLFVVAYFSIVFCAGRVWVPITKAFYLYHYLRWRPPLRAPPLQTS